ncbi:MAG: sugar transferase [Deferribacterales bacterium]
MKKRFYLNYLKHPLEFLLALAALLVLSPMIITIALLVRVKLGSPVVFCQARPGLNGQLFTMYKFRSMTEKKDKNGNLLPDAERLTRFGKFLRASSLDELPELINVIKGEMSLVGPRPLLVEYLPLYSSFEARRHEVRPGITGWAQINGRNAITWEDKFKFDVWYVDNAGFLLDMKVIFLTLFKVVKRSDISQDGQATMSKFKGSE